MKKKYDVDQFLKFVTNTLENGEQLSEFPSHFYRSYYEGSRTVYQKSQTVSKKFDLMWIKTIESYFPSINRITVNLKSTLKYQNEIIPVEKAKKINKESVMHLMMHSNFIREVNDDEVIPKQILTTLSEVEYGIYENRFIMTLIVRLRDFIGKRIMVMRDEIKGSHVTRLNVGGKFDFDGSAVDLSLDLKRTEPADSRKNEEYNELVLEKAEKLLKLITKLNNSQFMQIMKRFKPVKPPIMKTQIILKNPDFRNAYILWTYLDRCTDLGYDLTVETVKNRFSKEYTHQINQTFMLLYSAMLANDKSATDETLEGKVTYKEIKAQTLQNLPDEIDVFNPVAIQVEDVAMNEYYLNRNKQILKKQLDRYSAEGSDKKIALQSALRETTAITDAIYESFFEVNADDDVYSRLVKEDNPQVMLDSAVEKYNISRAIREVKEEDFMRAVQLEKKWQETLKEKKNAVVDELKAEADKTVAGVADKGEAVYAKNAKKDEAATAQQQIKKARDIKKKLAGYEKNLMAELRKEKAAIAAQTKQRIAAEKKQMKEKEELRKIREAERRKLLAQKQKEKMLADKERLRKKKAEQKKKYIKAQKEKIAAAKSGKSAAKPKKKVAASTVTAVQPAVPVDNIAAQKSAPTAKKAARKPAAKKTVKKAVRKPAAKKSTAKTSSVKSGAARTPAKKQVVISAAVISAKNAEAAASLIPQGAETLSDDGKLPIFGGGEIAGAQRKTENSETPVTVAEPAINKSEAPVAVVGSEIGEIKAETPAAVNDSPAINRPDRTETPVAVADSTATSESDTSETPVANPKVGSEPSAAAADVHENDVAFTADKTGNSSDNGAIIPEA